MTKINVQSERGIIKIVFILNVIALVLIAFGKNYLFGFTIAGTIILFLQLIMEATEKKVEERLGSNKLAVKLNNKFK